MSKHNSSPPKCRFLTLNIHCTHEKISKCLPSNRNAGSSPSPSARFPSNQCLTDTSPFSLLLFVLFHCFPSFSGMFCLVGLLQDGSEDSEMFYILQMACDHNCTAEGICWDLLIGCAVLRDHVTLSVSGATCRLWLACGQCFQFYLLTFNLYGVATNILV